MQEKSQDQKLKKTFISFKIIVILAMIVEII